MRRMAESLESSDSTIVHLANEEILIPANADVSCKYGTAGGAKELKIRVTWDLVPSAPQLIHQHSERVQGVHWETYTKSSSMARRVWTEPGRVGSNSFRQARVCLRYALIVKPETQPDLKALEIWSTGFEPM